jgi:hypothetical protein
MSHATMNSLPAPRARPRIDAMLTTGARISRAVESSQGCIPVGPGGIVTVFAGSRSVS